MTAKKKVDNEAGDTAEVVDTEAVEAAADDAPAEVKDLKGKSVPVGDDGIPVLSESTPVDEPVEIPTGDLATAQSVLGVPITGSMNHGTKQALRQWQRKNGLPPSGQLDTRTKGAMHF